MYLLSGSLQRIPESQCLSLFMIPVSFFISFILTDLPCYFVYFDIFKYIILQNFPVVKVGSSTLSKEYI